jgi:3-isopropylmalate/(R)-2-methylmalate dehydratase small subunit
LSLLHKLLARGPHSGIVRAPFPTAMALAKITTVSGRAVFVPGADIDTDRIIPARFMKCVTFDGLGEFAFYDVRKNEDGSDKPHPLNEPRFAGASILISGANFGCGSSREHAPQALYRFGFRAVLAESFAEIFFGNCATLGIPCLKASTADIAALAAAVDADPTLEVSLDVVNETVTYAGKTFKATTTPSAREALTTGQWDPIAELLDGKDAVDAKMKAFGWAA